MKFTPEGIPQWDASGTVIRYLGEYPEICPDGTGGLVGIVRRSMPFDHHLFAFRLDSAANWVWQTEGLDLGVMYWAKSLLCKYPHIYVAWDSGSPPPNRTAKLHKMDYQGNSVWEENLTVFSSTIGQYEVDMCDADDTGLLFTGYQNINGALALLYAQKYNYEGERLWEDDVLLRSLPVGYLHMHVNDFGGGLFSWREIDATYGQLTCAAMVNAYGELGIVVGIKPGARSTPICENISVFPNPVNSQLKLYLPSFLLPDTAFRLSLIDILGQTLFSNEFRATMSILPLSIESINGSNLCSGPYYLQVIQGEQSWTTKFLYLK